MADDCMIQLDEILYNAITADAALMESVGSRVKSTCFEVSPDEPDNTPLPCIIVIDGGMQSQSETKDAEWEGAEDHVQAAIEVSARSPREVKRLIRQARHAVAAYVATLGWNDRPYLDSLQTDGVAWDWMKPCYFDTLRYQCTIQNEDYNEQED